MGRSWRRWGELLSTLMVDGRMVDKTRKIRFCDPMKQTEKNEKNVQHTNPTGDQRDWQARSYWLSVPGKHLTKHWYKVITDWLLFCFHFGSENQKEQLKQPIWIRLKFFSLSFAGMQNIKMLLYSNPSTTTLATCLVMSALEGDVDEDNVTKKRSCVPINKRKYNYWLSFLDCICLTNTFPPMFVSIE